MKIKFLAFLICLLRCLGTRSAINDKYCFVGRRSRVGSRCVLRKNNRGNLENLSFRAKIYLTYLLRQSKFSFNWNLPIHQCYFNLPWVCQQSVQSLIFPKRHKQLVYKIGTCNWVFRHFNAYTQAYTQYQVYMRVSTMQNRYFIRIIYKRRIGLNYELFRKPKFPCKITNVMSCE